MAAPILRTTSTRSTHARPSTAWSAWTLSGTQLTSAWKNGNGGTSPVVVDGMAFVYGPGGGLRVYDAASGNLVTTLSCGGGHWNSPIVADGRIALPEGNANDHRTSGVLDIWRIP